MWEMPLETQQPASVINNILAQISKSELEQYLHAEIFIPTTASLIKAIKNVFLRTLPGLNKKLIKRHLENQVSRKWDICTLEDRGYIPPKKNLLIQTCKTRGKQMECFAQLYTLAQLKKGRSTQIYADSSPLIQVGETNIFTSCMCMTVTTS